MLKKLLKFNKLPSRIAGIIKSNLKLIITGVETSEKVIALTFDDGPDPKYTLLILDLLDKHNAKATFFFVGESAAKYPSLIERVAEAGHEIGNHTWSHLVLPSVSINEQLKQIKKTKDLFSSYPQKYFRPPWGFLSFYSYLIARFLGYSIIYWSFAAQDWSDKSADEIFYRLDTSVQPGSIILMHDALYHTIRPEYSPRDTLIDALDRFLQKNNSYDFVTTSRLIQLGRPIYKFGIHSKKNVDKFVPADK